MTTTTWRMVSATRIPVTAGLAWCGPADPSPEHGNPAVDWIAVERVLRGTLRPGALNRAERVEAAAILHRLGNTDTMITKRLRVSGSTVNELLAAAGLLPPEDTCVVDDCWRARKDANSWGLCRQCYTAEQKRVADAACDRETAPVDLEAVAA